VKNSEVRKEFKSQVIWSQKKQLLAALAFVLAFLSEILDTDSSPYQGLFTL
jgi:nitrate reductase assembly molybdenum cofactor insertion protein NarJ